MPVEIHGKQYVTVAERIAQMHDAGVEGGEMIVSTEIVRDTDTSISIKATVTCAAGTFSGHATSRYEAGGIEGQSPLEVAETSAIGRALGFAGYGSVEGIASADEVVVAQARTSDTNKPWGCKDCRATNLGADSICINCGRGRGS
jgi:hypothetical protein